MIVNYKGFYMVRSAKYFLFSIFAVVSIFLCSCEGKTDIKVLNNGAVSFNFEGNIGGTFKEMMTSLGEDGGIDNESIKMELLQAGFSNVKVFSNNDVIKISFTDEKRKSPLFNLGILAEKNNDLSISITPENFLKLYNVAGEEIQSILDLFLSPVLNEEVMSQEDYVDTISVTYGDIAGKEIDKSIVRFNIINKNGKAKKRTVYVKSILCGEKIFF